MPRRKAKLSPAEAQEYRHRCLLLKDVGIPVGCDDDFMHQPGRLLLEFDPDLATIHDLPGSSVAVVAPVKLRVLASRMQISECQMTLPWYEFSLELREPEQNTFYQDIIKSLIPFPPILVNSRLTGERPLYRGQIEGVFVAFGLTSVPQQYEDMAKLPVRLSLRDERDNEIDFDLEALVSRTVKHVYERRQREQPRSAHYRQPIFEREEAEDRGPAEPTVETRPAARCGCSGRRRRKYSSHDISAAVPVTSQKG